MQDENRENRTEPQEVVSWYVRPEGQEAFVRNVECAHLCRVSGVKHEIYRSPNAQLRPYLQAVFGFLLDGALPENAAKA